MEQSKLDALQKIYPVFLETFKPVNPDVTERDPIVKINEMIRHINQIGKVSHDTVDNWNKVMEWVLNEDLSEVAKEKIEQIVENGRFDEMIVDTTNSFIEEKTTQLNAALNQLNESSINITQFGAIADANFYNPVDKKYYKDSEFKTPATDNTDFIQRALDFPTQQIRTVTIPDGVYMVNAAKKLILRSNTKLVFSKNAKFVSMASWRDISSILDIVGVENIELINPVLVGDRDLVNFTTEGAGHGISVRGCKNLFIQGGHISKCFTDGIYLNNVENCRIEFLTCDHNRRQGLSLISAKNFLCRNSAFSNTNGIPPMMGIDIEPNTANENFVNVVFENITTANNAASGIGINLNQLNDVNKIIDITIKNWKDVGSSKSFSAMCYAGNVSEVSKIVIENMIAVNPKFNAIDIGGYKADNTPLLQFIKPTIHNPNTSNETNERHQNVAISVHTDVSGYPAGLEQGNVEIIEPKITMAAGRKIQRGIYIGFTNPFKKISIKNPVKIDIGEMNTLANNSTRGLIGFNGTSNGEVIITDDYQALNLKTDAALIRNFDSNVYTNYITTLQSGTVTLRDWNRWDIASEFYVMHDGGSGLLTLNVVLPISVKFFNELNEEITGTYSTTIKGSILKFKKIKQGVFRVTKELGTWIRS